MQSRFTVVLIFFCAACRFVVSPFDPALPAARADLAAPIAVAADLAAAPPGADLTVAARGADLAAASAADLARDPCADAPVPAAGTTPAQCAVGNAPVVDGNLGEWANATFVPLRHAGAAIAGGTWDGSDAADDADASLRVALRWDLANLYLAVAVTDDLRRTGKRLAIDAIDGVELYLDGQHDRTQAYGADDWRLVVAANGLAAAFRDPAAVDWPPGGAHAVASTGSDYAIEVAIPWSQLGGGEVKVGRAVGFDVQLNDADSAGGLDRWLDLFYAATGGGACAEPSCRTDAFGTVQLAGR